MKRIEADNHKLVFHPKRVWGWLEKGDCFPIYVEIGTTNRCNHRCIFCALDFLGYKPVDIDSKVMQKTLEEMACLGVKSVMFAGEGEPLLHKNISLFVQTSKKYGMDVSMTTNGILFNQKKLEEILPYLSWIRFSVDAGTSETYAQIHRTNKKDFEKLISNMYQTVQLRNEKIYPATIGVQFLLIPQNLKEALLLTKKAKEIGVDNIQIKPYSHHPLSKNEFKIDYSKIEYLKEDVESYSDKNFQAIYRDNTVHRLQEGKDYNECYGLPFFALITAKGDIIPCNLFYENPEFSYGNINQQGFKEIWLSEKRKEVIKKLKERGIKECRGSCRLDPLNRYLHRLKNPHPHDNFI